MDVLKNRGQYATFITILLAGIVISVSSMLVLEFESRGDDGNIQTGGDAIWWALVTITTVGYGDIFPVTFLGRLTGVFVMFAGIGIIGALARASGEPVGLVVITGARTTAGDIRAGDRRDTTGRSRPPTPDLRAEIAALAGRLAARRRLSVPRCIRIAYATGAAARRGAGHV